MIGGKMNKKIFSIAWFILLLITIFSCTSIIPNIEKASSANNSEAILSYKDDAILLSEPFQPDEKTKEILKKIVYISDSDTPINEGKNPNHVIVDGIPYYRYQYLTQKDSYSFHPMSMGRYMKNNTNEINLNMILSASVEIPNSGIVWYYPSNYQNSRMLGPYWKYSCISQGTILAGLTKVGALTGNDYSLALRAFNGILFPFYNGGVNLEGVALLEMPSYKAAPEIVLNGWLDALFHISDYANASGDEKALKLLSDNLSFLSRVLKNFDSEDNLISRYSDLCPYRVRIYFNKADNISIDSLKILYTPKYKELKPIIVPLQSLKQDTISIYDNQIIKITDSYIDIYLSISGLYDTIVLADFPFKASINPGMVNLKSTTPGSKGISQTSEASFLEEFFYINFSKNYIDLIPGYPTNFSKYDKYNYYHVYHVVALMLLAKQSNIPLQEEKIILEYALKWYDYMEKKILPHGLEFYSTETMLRDINNNQYIIEEDNWENLLQWAKQEYSKLSQTK